MNSQSRDTGHWHLPLLIVSFAGFAACVETTATDDLTCPSAAVALCTSADSTRSVVGPLTADAATRSSGALGNEAAKTQLRIELNALAEAIAAGNVTQGRNALDRARAALAVARTQLADHPGDAPDLTVIELALIQAARAL